jgi:hypothetical protein
MHLCRIYALRCCSMVCCVTLMYDLSSKIFSHPRGAMVRASGAKIWWSLRRGFEFHCGTWVPVSIGTPRNVSRDQCRARETFSEFRLVPVFRMRPCKPRPRVAIGVARLRSIPAQRPWVQSIGLNLQRCHRQWWEPPDSWKIARVAINKQTNKTYLWWYIVEVLLWHTGRGSRYIFSNHYHTPLLLFSYSDRSFGRYHIKWCLMSPQHVKSPRC